MNDTALQDLLKITKDSRVELGKSYKDFINTRLHLGMSKYVCKYGTLSDGHEKITPAQRYYQAIKEMYVRAEAIEEYELAALDAQADLIEAEETLSEAKTEAQKLRAEVAVRRAKKRIKGALVNAQDSMRQLEAFDEVRQELQEQVETKYPGGIEQAEEDNQKAVAEYRIMKKMLGYQEHLTHIPLRPEVKAEMGLISGHKELVAALIIDKKDEIENKYDGDVVQYLKDALGSESLIARLDAPAETNLQLIQKESVKEH
ncbi:MAG TPA: hypothetical protein VEF04_01850 [Blastocatellia bacterium]|nr:hypothetical protein [Blastocatellia bacterium]